MNRDEYLSYSSEIEELEQLLKELPADRVFERASLEARLRMAKETLLKFQYTSISPLVKNLCSHSFRMGIAIFSILFFNQQFQLELPA